MSVSRHLKRVILLSRLLFHQFAMKLGIGIRITIIIAIQISLIAGSFALLAYFESKNALLGNSINIAGKNRFLTSNVLLETQYYLAGESQYGDVQDALAKLKNNILALRDGGNVGGIQLDPIQSGFNQDWDLVYADYLTLENQISILAAGSPDSTARSQQLAVVQLAGKNLITISDSLVSKLANYSKNNSGELLNLQVSFGVINIAVHAGMLYTILRILRPIKLLTRASSSIKQGNLDVFIQQTGNYELQELADSFNAMVASLKKSTELLAIEKKKYKELYDGAPDLYRMVNADGILLECNESYWKGLDYSSKEELIGKSVFETTADRSLLAMRDSLDTWKKTGLVFNREIWLKRKDGSTFPTLLSATALRDDNGTIIASNTCLIDVTEIYKVRKELEDANTRLRELDTLKSEFISIASHELRTPIQPILNCAELVRAGIMPQEQAWEIVTKEAARLKSIANDILDAAKIEGGELKLHLEVFSINDIVRIVMYGFELSKPKQVQLRTVFGEDQELYVNADRSRLIQVFANILGNALKHTREGYIDIQTGLADNGQSVEVSIIDSGKGIPAEILPRLFEKFATKDLEGGTESGTGLGLFISKGIIEAHNGSIVGFNNQTGATFKVRLPVAEISSKNVQNHPASTSSFREVI